VGFKPTYGRVSNRGVVPNSWKLDHVGPLCRTVEDAALMLGVIAGYDPLDTTTVNTPVPDYNRAFKMHASKLRLGVPRTPFFDSLDPDIAKAVAAALEVLRKLTATVPELFVNAAGNAMTRAGFEYILHKHARTAAEKCPALKGRSVSPHQLRHGCAVVMLQATRDVRKVALWLGHADIRTTEIYLRVDPSEKLEAIETVLPLGLRRGRFKAPDALIAFLQDQG
jgi:Asp-tRNA(Asn)/Glu-tRNA(Gln) amidotransferase A subunit family amidase